MPVNAVAAKVIRPYLVAIRKYLKGAQSGRSSVVLHQLRVYLRRTRNMVDFFGALLPKKKRKYWDKQMRRIAEATSFARDMDVYLSFLARYKKSLRSVAQKSGLEQLARRERKRQGKARSRVVRELDRFVRKGLLADIAVALQGLSKTAKREEPFRIYKFCRKGLLKRARALLAYDAIVRQPSNVRKLHEMRLAAKHVRYSLEGVAGLYDRDLKTYIGHVWVLHRQLGEIHDYDVWQDHLTDHSGNKDIDGKEKAVVRRLKAYIRAQRTKSYKAFLAKWSRIKTERVLEGLVEYLYAYER